MLSTQSFSRCPAPTSASAQSSGHDAPVGVATSTIRGVVLPTLPLARQIFTSTDQMTQGRRADVTEPKNISQDQQQSGLCAISRSIPLDMAKWCPMLSASEWTIG